MRSHFLYSSVLGCALLLGCGAVQGPSGRDSAGAGKAPAGEPGESGERKIIYTAEIDLIVEDFTSLPAQLEALASQYEAFVSKADYSGSSRAPRHGQWTIRVPASRYSEFLAEVRKLGDVTHIHSDAQDISEEYADLQARLRNKRQEETRLLALLKDATGNLADVLAVERELMRVRGEIEQGEGRQRLLDDRVALATVILRAREVKDYFPEESATYLTRARRALVNSTSLLTTTVQDLSIAAVALLPWLAALGIPAAVVVVLARRRWKRPPASVAAR
jgi:hypothetical protein